MQQYGHHSAITIDATFGTNENKVNFLIVTYIAKPRKPLKHNETWLLYVISIVHIDGVWRMEELLSSCVHNHILE